MIRRRLILQHSYLASRKVEVTWLRRRAGKRFIVYYYGLTLINLHISQHLPSVHCHDPLVASLAAAQVDD